MIYDYVITKPPLNEDTLAHYGVKGMKWGKRKKQMLAFRSKHTRNDGLSLKSMRRETTALSGHEHGTHNPYALNPRIRDKYGNVFGGSTGRARYEIYRDGHRVRNNKRESRPVLDTGNADQWRDMMNKREDYLETKRDGIKRTRKKGGKTK